ncbi:acetyl-CoA acetyltransferase [Nocardia barduliensis]|uniref:acetyl-CoA acetyltransferase n=1 Tax=Nocardia barduliensis TaxID=2736643 RepID=UPI001574AD47|nr:acetyl-CoA acetyltransferase [Nocardia barduliensis]
MTLDPRTPVLVGAGQHTEREGGREPIDLLTEAAEAAAADAGTARLLTAVEAIRVVGLLSWRYRDPGALLAQRIGADVRSTGYTGNGGNSPQTLLNAAASEIAAGRLDVALIGGAESWRTRMGLRGNGIRPEWTVQDESVPAAALVVPEVPMATESERRIGLDRPAYVYPLFEQALRIAAGTSIAEHRARIGALWSEFSAVAAANPHAWTRKAFSADEITTASAGNRWIAAPYTKLMNSNSMVDQAAALLLCSAAVAERFGVPRDRWIFPQSGTDAHDTYAVAERGALHRSPAIRIAGARALALAGIGTEEVGPVDLYSCFPSAVQVAATELGLPLHDADRPLTVTGGLSFAGGPWNNYSTHAIAAMAGALRAAPGAYGLVTANGGYLTKHAIGVYRTEPPAHGFRHEDVQAEVDREPTTAAATSYAGTAALEAWTVVYDRDGVPETAFVAARTPDGARTLARSTDPDTLSCLAGEDAAGKAVVVGADGDCALT